MPEKFAPTTEANLVDKIIAFEAGDMNSEEEVADFFQHLIDTGIVWQLQGSYIRAAQNLIEGGYCKPPATSARR